jgi:hypothetical protein
MDLVGYILCMCVFSLCFNMYCTLTSRDNRRGKASAIQYQPNGEKYECLLDQAIQENLGQNIYNRYE